MSKTDTIEIKVTGSKKFRQEIIDRIYEVLMDEDLQAGDRRTQNGFTLESTIEPSEELII